VILRPDPVFMPLSVHWAVSGDSLETRNSHEARGSLQRASPEASTRENKRDREFFCRHMANRKADVRCVFSGEESFQPTPLLQTFRGVGELAPLSQPMRVSDDQLLLFVLQATQ